MKNGIDFKKAMIYNQYKGTGGENVKSYYRIFKANLPIPMRISLNVTNSNGEVKSLHTSKSMRVGVAKAKHTFPSMLNYFEILYCYKGQFTYSTDLGDVDVKEGECLAIGRRRIRNVCKDETREHFVYALGFEHEFCKSIGVDDTITGIIPTTDIVPVNCIKDIIKEFDGGLPGWENRMQDIAKSMLLHINNTYKEKSCPVNDKNILPDEYMLKIDAYIRAHVSEKITLDDLAELVGLKSTQFNKRFKITTGYTPVEYINILRCRAAREFILTTDFSLEEIISMCGYNDRSYFYKRYKEVYDTNAYDDIKTAPYR